MERIVSASRRRPLWLAVSSVAVLALLALSAPGLERKPAADLRQVEQSVKQPPSKQPPLETSPMPVQWQLDQLRARIQELEGQVGTLHAQVQQHGAAGSNVAGRLAALEGAVQVGPNKLRLQSPGAVEIRAPGNITVDAGAKVVLKASNTDVNSAHLRVQGIAQSEQVITQSVVSASYTPGAGNVW